MFLENFTVATPLIEILLIVADSYTFVLLVYILIVAPAFLSKMLNY